MGDGKGCGVIRCEPFAKNFGCAKDQVDAFAAFFFFLEHGGTGLAVAEEIVAVVD